MIDRKHMFFAARRRRRGASAVEFGLVFMVFSLILAGLIEVGRGVFAFTTIAHAARQGARYAQSRGTENGAYSQEQLGSAVREATRNAAVGLNRNQVEVTTTWPTGVDRGNFVMVQVRYPFDSVAGSLLLQQSRIEIRASSRVPIAN